MSTHDRDLESYLSRLEEALKLIPTSDRSEIILEIKSHVLESKERYPEKSLHTLLEGLGEPESVANKYLLERGLKPGKPSKSPMVKWLTIGFLGTIGIVALVFVVTLWKFTPLVSIQDEGVVLLGGAISIGSSSTNDWGNEEDNENYQSGLDAIENQWHADLIQTVDMKLGAGDVHIQKNESDTVDIKVERIKWHPSCKLILDQVSDRLEVSVEGKKRKSCRANVLLKLVKGVQLKVKQGSGDLKVEGIAGHFDLITGSGDVLLKETKTEFLNIKTGSGDVDVNSHLEDVDIRTGSGDVHLVYKNIPSKGSCHLRSGSANMRLEFPKESKLNVAFQAGHGTLQNQFANEPGEGYRVSAKAGSGNLSVVATSTEIRN